MHEPGAPWYALIEAQSGVVSRSQALAHGFSRHAIAAQVRARRWQIVRPGVLAVFTGPLPERHRLWAATLAGGRGAAIAGESAAFRHQILPEAPEVIVISVPAERRVKSGRDLRVLRVRGDRRVSGSPPTVSLEDALCDLASSWSTDRLGAAVGSALQRRLTTPDRVLRRIEARGPIPGAVVLRSLVDDSAAGAHSALEHRYLRDVERAHGLPVAVRQARAQRGGRTSYRDVFYSEFALVVELDGARFHDLPGQRRLDALRDNAAAGDGEVTLRYGWRDVDAAPCGVAAEVARVLRLRGWTGRPRSCRRCGRSRRSAAA